MAVSIAMPLLSPTMTEGKIAKWSKKEGDPVKSGDALAEVETDKATLDVEAYDAGTLLKIVAPAGSVVKVGGLIAIVGKPGEDVSALVAGAAAPAAATPGPAVKSAPPPAAPQTPQAKASESLPPTRPGGLAAVVPSAPKAPPPAFAAAPAPSGGRTRSSPLARKLASAGGLEVSQIVGSGPSGRVIKRDVEEALHSSGAAKPTATTGPEEVIPLSGMRKVIAERLVAAKRDIPHFYLTVEIDMERTVALRAELKEAGVAASINDFIVRACALGLTKVPAANRSWGEAGYIQHRTSDIGVAVALEDGLITPVIRNAETKSVSAIASEVKALAERGRNRKLKPEEYTGGSMSVSNLGMYGIEEFSAVINPPQASILAVGAVTERPAAVEGKLVVRKRMTVTLSCDHRVIDGALGAKLLAEIKQLLEKPVTLGF
jgi:pyruvate dehydrogenase E2 component (dihydrolipoamide acetyltransferase)